jgi:hypothetical protein
LHEFRDIYRTKMGADPSAQVEPMQIRLVEGATPVRVRAR